MHLEDLGWDEWFELRAARGAVDQGDLARVAAAGAGIYRVLRESGEALAEPCGRLRHAASGRRDLPAVGDWVVLRAAGGGRAGIREVLPRRTVLARKVAGRESEAQVLAANVDVVFIVTSLNRDLNPRRLERYLALTWESGASPVVILAKADLVADPAAAIAAVQPVASGAPVLAASARDGSGLDAVAGLLGQGRTGVFVGSSGAGKSSLINGLLARGGEVPHAGGRGLAPPAARQATGPIRASDDRGRHTTTARQLLVLPDGGLVIDTPGLRELQLWESDAGVAQVFADVDAHARGCRFRDCRHAGEPGCAVEQAVRAGELASGRVESHRKLLRELAALAIRTDPRQRIEERARIKRLTRAQRRRDPWE